MRTNTNAGYSFFINDFRLPVTPGKLTMKVKGKNKTINLAEGSEINILNPSGLTEYEFDILLPMREGYPFAYYADGFHAPDWYLLQLGKIVDSRKPCTFTIVRVQYANAYGTMTARTLFNQDTRVSIESYTVKEDASSGADLTVSIKLKQYVDYGTKIVRVLGEGETASVETTRETDNAPSADTHTVSDGDSLWLITKKYTGDGSRYKELMEANDLRSTSIHEGQVLTLPW